MRLPAVFGLLAAIAVAGCAGEEPDPYPPPSVNLYFVSHAMGRIGVLAPVDRRSSGKPTARSLVADLLAGPTPAQAQKGLTSAIPAGAELRELAMRNGVATVDLEANRVPRGIELAAQLVYTLTQLSEVGAVEVRLHGKRCCVYGHDGRVLARPLTPSLFGYWSGEPCHLRVFPDQARCRDSRVVPRNP